MQNFLNISRNGCGEPFKEQNFFQIESKSERDLALKEIRSKFYNISKILDCVSCEKCRLNGKV
jgi:hypothetical protein